MSEVEDLHGNRSKEEILQDITAGRPKPPWHERINWSMFGVLVALVSVIAVIMFGVANLISGHVSDVNATVNHGFDRVESAIRSETGEIRSDISNVRNDVSGLAVEVGYLKGRQDRNDEIQPGPPND